MHLLQLPAELLGIIAQDALPYSFENLSLTCKQLYKLAASFLPRHNELRKKYRSVVFGDSGSHTTVSALLAEIAAEPIIAAYIVHVDLDNRELREEGDNDDEYMEEMTEKLRPLVLGSPHLALLSEEEGDGSVAETWLEKIVQDVSHEDMYEDNAAEFSIPFLASLLVNVETLTLPDNWCDSSIFKGRLEEDEDENEGEKHPVTALLQLLVARANDTRLTDQPLQRLRTIKPTYELIEQNGTHMERLFPFMALDALREVHHYCGSCDNVRASNKGMPFPTLGRHLEVLKLDSYVLDAHSIEVLFAHMQRLRVLELEYSMKDELGYEFVADIFMRRALTATHASLERLVLTAGQVNPDTDVVECSLREFSKLQYLELSTVFLVNGPGAMPSDFTEEYFDTEVEEESSDEEEQAGEDEARQEDEDIGEGKGGGNDGEDEDGDAGNHVEGQAPGDEDMEDEQDEGDDDDESLKVEPVVLRGGEYHPDDKTKRYTNGKAVWRLVSVLPASLETLVLHVPAAPRHAACVERMFWRFEELCAERLPRLTTLEVRVRTKTTWDQELEESAEQVARLERFFADKKILTKFEVN